ncbi:MAG: RloB family protein [Candidatus Wallbacteria bacterium]|nr:RloB family protein [Candidatus Wallbacteria bacterium]
MKQKGRFQRKLGERRYKKLFVIASEGEKTEPMYFNRFNRGELIVKIKCLKNEHNSAPPRVLNRLKEYLKIESLRKTDEAWLVIDKDRWTDEQLKPLVAWAKTKVNYGFALSNPNFEYWQLLHFEDGAGVSSVRDCRERLSKYIPDCGKASPAKIFTEENIINAISRAKAKDNPPCIDWPHTYGSTVYRLVEKIFNN